MRLRKLLLLTITVGCAAFPLASYRGPRTDHFNGKKFRNIEPFAEQDVQDVLFWQFARQRGVWRDEKLPLAAPPPRRVTGREMRVTFINHATVLLQMDSLNILTDPVYSDRVGPLSWLGARRHWPAGVRFEDLPPIDVVLLSHDHYDHMDVPTLKRIVRTFHPRIIAGLGNSAQLRSLGVNGVEDIDWWHSVAIAPGVRVTGVPAQHWSGRTLTDHYQTLWLGFVIEGRADTVYFAGDTGWGKFFELIHQRYKQFRLAFLPIAPFHPHWYMHRKHESPSDAVKAAQLLHASTSVAIHWGTFELGDEGQWEPADTLNATLSVLAAQCRPRFLVLQNGQSADIPARAASWKEGAGGEREGCNPSAAELPLRSPK